MHYALALAGLWGHDLHNWHVITIHQHMPVTAGLSPHCCWVNIRSRVLLLIDFSLSFRSYRPPLCRGLWWKCLLLCAVADWFSPSFWSYRPPLCRGLWRKCLLPRAVADWFLSELSILQAATMSRIVKKEFAPMCCCWLNTLRAFDLKYRLPLCWGPWRARVENSNTG